MSLEDLYNLIKERNPVRTLESTGQILTIPAAGDYAAEDIIARSATLYHAWEFPGIASKGGESRVLVKAEAMWETTALTPRFILYLFSAIPSGELRDNVANTQPVLTNWEIKIGHIEFAALSDKGGVSEALCTPGTPGNLPIYFNSPANNKILGILVTADAITGEAAGSRIGLRLHSIPI